MKRLILVLLTVLFVSNFAFADKIVNPDQGWREGLREQGDTCDDPLIAVVGDNTAPYAPVWYEYTATLTGEATISSCVDGQSVDTKLYVYDQCEGAVLAENDDAYCSAYDYASELTFSVEEGVSYIVYWDDYWTSDAFDWWILEEENLVPEIINYSMVWSTDLVSWFDVIDNTVEIDPQFDYTYLNLSDINTSLPLMAGEMNEFFVNTYPAGWFDYWAAKGVIDGASGWQGVMWEIINGNAPIMYLLDDGRSLMLVDGLQYQVGAGVQNLRVSGDYLLGDYTYTGTVLGADGTPSEDIEIPLTFEEPFVTPQGDLCGDPIPLTLPVIDLAGSSEGFSNDYTYSGSNYMNGIDIVYQMTIDEDGGFLQGSLAGVGYSYPGLFILDGCPDGEYNTILAQGHSTLVNFSGIAVDAGTYYVIVSNWPTPDDFEYTLNIEWYEWVPDPGEVCETAIEYYFVNDPAQTGSIEANEAVWYEFYLDDTYFDVTVSLLNSDYDTKLEVWGDCGDATYLAYNDDWSGRGTLIQDNNIDKTQSRVVQSQIVFDELEAGSYYAKVYGYGSNFGNYELEITGNTQIIPVIDDYALEYTVDMVDWIPVAGDVVVLDPQYDFTYINTSELVSNVPLMPGEMNEFYIDTYPAGWFDYWAASGVVEGATGWQAIAWEIINGNAPIVYLLNDGRSSMLVDGLLYQYAQEISYLRINGTYLLGDYTIEGTILSEDGVSSEPINIPITFEEPFVAPPGYDCANPYAIDTLPFIETGFTTEGFGDDYENADNPCGTSYLGGDDFVFQYIPFDDIMLDIALSNTGTWVGLFVFQGSLDEPGAECVSYATASGGNPSLSAVPFLMGETYYIVISTWPSPQFTAFDISITEYIPPVYGDLSGYVTDAISGDPIEGAVVELSFPAVRHQFNKAELSAEKIAALENEVTRDLTGTTDVTGYYEIWDVLLGSWDLVGTAGGYVAYSTEIEIYEGANTYDFGLDPVPDWNTHVQITTDTWGYETTWNIWDFNTENWWWGEDIGDLDNNAIYDWYLDLPVGLYEVHVWDEWGDGGASGIVFDYDGNILLEWSGYSYGDEYTGFLPIGVDPGAYCVYPLDYGMINDPAVGGSIVSYESVWYEVTLDQNYTTVGFSLLNSDFDTKLEVWGDCGDDTYLAYNDDWYGRNTPLIQTNLNKSQSRVAQSYIGFDILEAGTYYAKVYGYGSSSGNYELEITGSLEPLAPEIDSYSLVSSIDLVNWSPVYNNEVEIDATYDYTYLNVFSMTTNVPLLIDNMNEFFVDTYPEGWFDYWAAKGVIEGAGSWQAVMWEIINGNAPIFYLKYEGRNWLLVDGLQYQIGQGEQNLRVSGDYLLGDYTYTGTILSDEGAVSELVTIPLTFLEPVFYIDGDAPSTAFVIDALPYFDSGDTSVDFTNFGNNNAPDVFYTFTLAETTVLDIHTCGSEFDTYLRLFDDTLTQVAYNDDGCSGWPTGLGSASWIEQYEADPGTYYIMVEGFSSYSGYYELTVEEYIPPVYGDLTGYVTDFDTGLPLEGATVNVTIAVPRSSKVGLSEKEIAYLEEQSITRIAATTDVDGYYEFLGLETGLYDVACSKTLYEPEAVQVEILEGANVQDFALAPVANWNVYLALTVDYFASEATYNLWMPEERGWYWATDQTFSAASETHEHYLDLPAGIFDVYCWDTFGDGGIAGIVQDENAVELLSWSNNDYSDIGIFTFYNDIEPGSICELAMDYGPINGPAQTGSIESYESVWYSFTIGDAHENVGISLLNSDFDTILELWGDCGDETYLAYNDDWLGRSSIGNGPLSPKEKEQYRVSQSYIEMAYLGAGTYYAKVYGYSSSSGNYELEITGDLVIASEVEGFVYDNETMDPLEGALVNPGIGGFEAYTDINGYYYIQNLPTGNYNFSVSMPGYASVTENLDVIDGLNQFNFYLDTVDYIEIGSGTSSIAYVPTYGWYDYSWSGTIYLQEEIGNAMTINKIAYHVANNPVNYTMPDQYVYMAHTDQDVITDNTYQYPAGVRDFQEIYSGTVVWNNGWIEIILDNAFDYNGVDNLMIWWDNFDGDYASGQPTFYYTNQANRAIYKYADGTFPATLTGTITYYVPNLRIWEGTALLPGETIANAIPVEFDEFNYYNDSGDLSPYADDYDIPGPDGADVVYALNLGIEAMVDVSLLNSDFDTKLAVYASDVEPGPENYLYYNDDYWGRFGGNELVNWARPIQINKENSRDMQSAIYDMLLGPGLYYIIVDGYGGETGIWDIEVSWSDACEELECVGTPEGEDMIPDGGEDFTNGGCNMAEPLFSSIEPGETVCGMLNTFINATGGNSRDMDWYLSSTGDEYEYYEVTVTLDYDFGDAALWLTNGLCGDDLLVYGFYDEAGYCAYEQGTFTTAAGGFGIIVAPPVFEGFPEGFNYALSVEVNEYIPPQDVFINVAVDSWYDEASWNVYDYQLESFLFAEDFTFAAGYETQTEALILDPGMYSVVCWDTYGDGGISGNVVHLMETLVTWLSYDYTSEGWFDFTIGGGMIYGDVDGNGFVEAYDTSNLLQYVVGLDPDAAPLPWSEDTMLAADVDGNAWINAYDGALILQYVVGYIDIFPVEELVRHNAPEALVEVEFIDNELIFRANGNLYGFEVEISSEIGSVETDVLHAVNGNKIAIASAEAITGEFLRIPVTADEVTIDMVINNAVERLELTSVPSVTALKSNYPNPFNPVTTIAFEVAEPGDVLIQIYNVKGQLVKTLVNDHHDTGSYTIQWNADGQASGVYFYKMKFGRYTSTKKMILMK
jgi:hypothetical protein